MGDFTNDKQTEAGQQESLRFARDVMNVEAQAVALAAKRLDASFLCALDLLHECRGTIIVAGVGKSGMAARKFASTLTSVGCAALFLHPAEALHGDLGIVRPDDVVVALSNSGESDELLAILPAIQVRGVPIIALTGNAASTLARKATVVLNAGVEREACPLNLAPTASVMVAVALGDALAMSLQKRRNLQPEEYALNHPGGRLGRRLTLRVRDIMQRGDGALPLVTADATFEDVVGEVSAKHVGAACIVDAAGLLLGIIAESELRQAMLQYGAEMFGLSAADLMNRTPAVTLRAEQMAYEALGLMEERPRPISVAPVLDESGRVIGMVHVHDLVRAGL